MEVSRGPIFKRDKYLSRIAPFIHSEEVKIITGVRGCGKTTLLYLIKDLLLEDGVKEEHIVFLHLEESKCKQIKTLMSLEAAISKVVPPLEKRYIFLDDVQRVKEFAPLINQLQSRGHSIFLTGNNAYLREEIKDAFSKGYQAFEILPFDFKEFLEFKEFNHLPLTHDKKEDFKDYLLTGGLPRNILFKTIEEREAYYEELVTEIFNHDIKYAKSIRQIDNFKKVASYLVAHFGEKIDVKNIIEQYDEDSLKRNTVNNYIESIEGSKIFYRCALIDANIHDAIYLNSKYYLVDGVFYSLHYDDILNRMKIVLENLVFLHLLSRGYRLGYYRVNKYECDFVAMTPAKTFAYIQVVPSLKELSEEEKEAIYRPFRSIKDGFPRYIISLDEDVNERTEGVFHLNIINMLLDETLIG